MTSYVSGIYSILSLLKQKQVLIGMLVLFYWPEMFPASIMYLSLSLFSMFKRYFDFVHCLEISELLAQSVA